jgi:hypothetical protein
MKSLNGMHFLFGIFVCAIALPLALNYYKDTRTHREQLRITIAEDILVRKLEVYQLTNGHYPDTIAVLSFTNSALEIQRLPDIRQVQYRRTKSGYTLQYNSIMGFHSLIASGNH